MSTADVLASLRWKKFPVLDDGFVCLVDAMGDDQSVVQAARVSYGEGTRKVSDDRGLIRYLMRHRHTTPFEMAEIKLLVRVPMDAWRQWIRHRMACLAAGTRIFFDLPGGVQRRGNQLYVIEIAELWRRFQPTRNRHRPDKQKNPLFRRDRVRAMRLRQIDEGTLRIQHTRVVDVFRNGKKGVFRMRLADGKQIEATADHRFLFADGWHTLRDATGLCERSGKAVWRDGEYFIYVNGAELLAPALYQERDWLDEQYNRQRHKIEDIAASCGVSYHTIRKWLRAHGVQHAKGGRSKKPWNHGHRYRLGRRKLTESWRAANRAARGGPASNFWRGGVSSDRESIGRWTTQAAARVHERNGWTCQLCHQRAGELHCHHVVPVWADVSLARKESNLTTLCGDCHRKVHGRELEYVERLGGPPVKAEWRKRPRVAWNKLSVARLVRIEGFEWVGEKETYDIQVEGPHQNFIANGIVTHNSVNEYSTRYSIAIDAAQTTPPDQWRLQAKGNRQGSEGTLDPPEGAKLSQSERELQKRARELYEERLARGIAREQARKDLPLSTYTEAYWKIDLHNLLHFLSLRMDDHAQWEIRQYAQTIGREILRPLFPLVWEAFVDYRLEAMQLSRLERELIARLMKRLSETGRSQATEEDFLAVQDSTWAGIARSRERDECRVKLHSLGILPPS
ncbi:MAG: FAD-dependent thymidylate synthase [Planctomycetia bacterium]|nr:FAD-dependent thymidylate synthase [Planctomycetia bacterium]